MLSKRYESTEVDRKTWLHVPSGTPWSTSSDTHQVVEIEKETSTKRYIKMYIKMSHGSCFLSINVGICSRKRIFGLISKIEKNTGGIQVNRREKTRQSQKDWSQQLQLKQVPKRGRNKHHILCMMTL